MTRLLNFIIIILICASCLATESCSGRRAKNRARRDRTERNEARASRHDRGHDSDERDTPTLTNNSEYIYELAQGDDYDAMLRELDNAVKEIRVLRKKYFKGNMKDKEMKEQLDAINKKYQPLFDRLQEAGSNGELTYNQHKKQMKLCADYLKEIVEVGNKLSSDIKDAFR